MNQHEDSLEPIDKLLSDLGFYDRESGHHLPKSKHATAMANRRAKATMDRAVAESERASNPDAIHVNVSSLDDLSVSQLSKGVLSHLSPPVFSMPNLQRVSQPAGLSGAKGLYLSLIHI